MHFPPLACLLCCAAAAVLVGRVRREARSGRWWSAFEFPALAALSVLVVAAQLSGSSFPTAAHLGRLLFPAPPRG